MKTKYIYSEKDLPQKSQLWHDFRKNHIGASEVPKIMGELYYKFGTPYDVFLLKMGKEPDKPNENMLRGIKFEDSARKFVTKYLKSKYFNKKDDIGDYVIDHVNEKLEFTPNFKQLTAKHKKINCISASFDGVDTKNGLILEIKCPKYENFLKFTKKSIVPTTYKSQVQTQLMVANSHWGITNGIFVSFYNEGVDLSKDYHKIIKMVILKVELDKEHCLKIEKTCKNFWNMVQNKEWDKYWNENGEY